MKIRFIMHVLGIFYQIGLTINLTVYYHTLMQVIFVNQKPNSYLGIDFAKSYCI